MSDDDGNDEKQHNLLNLYNNPKSLKSISKRPIQHSNNNTIKQLFLPIIQNKIFCYLANSALQLTILSSVCFEWNTEIIINSNNVWEILCRYKWKYISKGVTPDSWQMFFRKRLYRIKIESYERYEHENEVTIENCAKGKNPIKLDKKYLQNKLDLEVSDLPDGYAWDFECPVSLGRIEHSLDSHIDRCTICKKNVYIVKDEEELKTRVDAGECVAFAPQYNILKGRADYKEARNNKMGKVVANLRPYPKAGGKSENDEDEEWEETYTE